MEPVIRNYEDIGEFTDDNEEALKKYDYYAVTDLNKLKNKVNHSINYIENMQLYMVITGKDLKRNLLKKANKQ